uniref:Temptin Cys/Cys disulfide domain-containing protein n=1 Tax=Hyaloperonospora arabidopsidis (strain Emoy2) TaxID=559515 RepID=M4BIW3_HYAAE
MKLPLALCTLSMTTSRSDARPSFVARIPNGNGVAGITALGHVNEVGGGATNAFGDAFGAAGHEWTKELCQADSDSDGASNGAELGDPCCTWTAEAGFDGTSSSATMSSPTHPGIANSFTESQLGAMVCGAEAELDLIASSGAASSISSDSASGSLASSSSLQDGGSSRVGSLSDDGMAQKDPRRGFSGSKVDRTVPPLTTSDAPLHCSMLALTTASFCLSLVLALAAN